MDAHLRHLEKYDLDFLKVMNDHQYPRGGLSAITSTADLRKLQPLPGDAEGLSGQLELLRRLRQSLGNDILMCTTMFNAWTLLRIFCRPPTDMHGPPKLEAIDDRDETISRLLKEDPAAVQAALDALARTLADFARLCLQAGADGIFLSVRDDWVNRPANGPTTYRDMVHPLDLMILEAAGQGSFNMLHLCGRPQDFRAFSTLPVHVLNWADRAAGPSIAYARDRVKQAIAGGVDNLKTLPEGTPEQCAAEVQDAIRQAGPRPILITPGCTFDPQRVPEANLKAMVAACRA